MKAKLTLPPSVERVREAAERLRHALSLKRFPRLKSPKSDVSARETVSKVHEWGDAMRTLYGSTSDASNFGPATPRSLVGLLWFQSVRVHATTPIREGRAASNRSARYREVTSALGDLGWSPRSALRKLDRLAASERISPKLIIPAAPAAPDLFTSGVTPPHGHASHYLGTLPSVFACDLPDFRPESARGWGDALGDAEGKRCISVSSSNWPEVVRTIEQRRDEIVMRCRLLLAWVKGQIRRLETVLRPRLSIRRIPASEACEVVIEAGDRPRSEVLPMALARFLLALAKSSPLRPVDELKSQKHELLERLPELEPFLERSEERKPAMPSRVFYYIDPELTAQWSIE